MTHHVPAILVRNTATATGRIPTRFAAGLATLAVLVALRPVTAGAQAPDAVLLNGKIVTLDDRSTVAEALAIRDGKITVVGANGAVRALAGPATRVVDLGGRTVIP